MATSKINETDLDPSMDIADKTTLDSVNDKVSNLQTTMSNLNIGATSDTGGSATGGTIFAKLNKIISDIATHVSSWTSTRAGYIDTINTNVAAIKTATAANNTASTTGTLSQKISSAIANTATNNTASKNGILSAKISYVISLLENSVSTSDKYYKPSDTVLSTIISSEIPGGYIGSSGIYNVKYLGSFIPKYDGIVKIKVSAKAYYESYGRYISALNSCMQYGIAYGQWSSGDSGSYYIYGNSYFADALNIISRGTTDEIYDIGLGGRYLGIDIAYTNNNSSYTEITKNIIVEKNKPVYFYAPFEYRTGGTKYCAYCNSLKVCGTISS